MILEIDGREIEVEEEDLPHLLELLKPKQDDSLERAFAKIDDTLSGIVPALTMAVARLQPAQAPDIKVTIPEQKVVKRITISEIRRDRNNMIESCDMELIR